MDLTARGEIAAVDPNKAMIRGYAAVTGNTFTYFDPFEWRSRRMLVEPGAFASVLARRAGKPLPIYWRHEIFGLQLGETAELFEDARGLFFQGNAFATSAAIDQLTVIASRSHTGASFMFEFGEIEKDDDGVEHILSFSEIYEVGPAPEGVNPEAYAEIVPRESAAIPEPAISDAALAAEIFKATQLIRSFTNA